MLKNDKLCKCCFKRFKHYEKDKIYHKTCYNLICKQYEKTNKYLNEVKDKLQESELKKIIDSLIILKNLKDV